MRAISWGTPITLLTWHRSLGDIARQLGCPSRIRRIREMTTSLHRKVGVTASVKWRVVCGVWVAFPGLAGVICQV
jgi:hypothetical protein